MPRVYNTDNPEDVAALMALHPPEARFEFRRQTKYDRAVAWANGLVPLEATMPLIQPDQWESVIKHCHDQQVFAEYAQARTWAKPGFKYNQNGLGYCWTWGGTGVLMDTRAFEDKETVPLAPVSMGYLVNWADRGNYLESFINGARERGICPAINGNVNDTRNQANVWTPLEAERKLYRLDNVWDTDNDAPAALRAKYLVSGLSYGRSGYAAWNWWGHATSVISVLFSPGSYLNIRTKLRNSHDEPEPIILEGSKCIPDELYFFASTAA